MVEKIFYTKDEYVKFDIPESGFVGAFMSGGADSSLMCFIMSKIIKEHNLPTKIIPVTTELLKRPYNLRFSHGVLEKITELTGMEFDHHPCFVMPNYYVALSDDEKINIMSKYTRAYAKAYGFLNIFNGLTANPPIEEVEDNDFGQRQKCRDSFEWREKETSTKGLCVPFIHIDKKVIAALYRKFDLIDSLFPLTRSCEAEMAETNFFTKDCFAIRPNGQECWWCRERAYGFSEQI